MKICWWTVYPTVNQTAILAAFRARGVDVAVCYFGQYDSYRRLLGWKDRPLQSWEHFAPTIAAAPTTTPMTQVFHPPFPSGRTTRHDPTLLPSSSIAPIFYHYATSARK